MRIKSLNDNTATLVVRLATRKNKVGALTRLINNASTNEVRYRYQQQKDQLIHSRDSINQELYDAFSNSALYNFTEVLFILESDHDRLKSGEKSGYFLNKNLEIDPSITLNTDKFFVVFLGTTPRSEDSRAIYTAFVTLDQFGVPVPTPFPAYIIWRKKLGSRDKSVSVKHLFINMGTNDAVIKYNRILRLFYEKALTW